MEKFKKQMIDRLDCIANLGANDNEIYDNLTAILELLNEFNVIDNDCYEDADITLTKMWGFNVGQ